MAGLEDVINEIIGQVRTDTLDLSFGEIVSLHSNNELIIQPDYQRLFRWSDEKKSRLIESILLELPIPQIFVIENSDGVFELIDGLQRVCSVLQFIDASVLKPVFSGEDADSEETIALPPLQLQKCNLIEELNEKYFNDLPLSLKLKIKRSPIRTVIIKKQSKSFLKYHMFQRLNTGGEKLEAQEIRNCSARMVGDNGIKFYEFLRDKASSNNFKVCISSLSQELRGKKGNEELVLRFFAAKNSPDLFSGNITDWLDDYMNTILLEKEIFEFESENEQFDKVFDFLARSLEKNSFVFYKNNSPSGSLKPAYYEAISVGVSKVIKQIDAISDIHFKAKEKIISKIQTDEFRNSTGSGSNKRSLLKQRITLIESCLMELIENE
jgi:hypothetical protein